MRRRVAVADTKRHEAAAGMMHRAAVGVGVVGSDPRRVAAADLAVAAVAMRTCPRGAVAVADMGAVDMSAAVVAATVAATGNRRVSARRMRRPYRPSVRSARDNGLLCNSYVTSIAPVAVTGAISFCARVGRRMRRLCQSIMTARRRECARLRLRRGPVT